MASPYEKYRYPRSIAQLASYLNGQRIHVLHRLMKIVTIRSVTHENICCLNTALLLLVFEQRRCVESTVGGGCV